jgi:hypothetical protein
MSTAGAPGSPTIQTEHYRAWDEHTIEDDRSRRYLVERLSSCGVGEQTK